MGAVWLCRDQLLGREVAVKQLGGLPGETAPPRAGVARGAGVRTLTQPNVVSIYDAVEYGDHVWLVMEHVPSQTLSALTKKEGALPPRRAARIGAQIAEKVWPQPTPAAPSTVTSSRATSWSRTATWRRSPTSASPATSTTRR